MTAASELDHKQRLAQLSERNRHAIMSAYLLRLKHQSNGGRGEIPKLMTEMDAGGKPNSHSLPEI